VKVDYDPAFAAIEHKDASGQTLAYIFTSDGRLFNAELIQQGHAFVREESFKYSEDFHTYEREAIAVMRGLWGMDGSSTASTSTRPTSPTASASATAGSEPGAASKPGKLTPLAPSEIGPNIPAVSGSSTVASGSPSEPMIFVSATEKLYHKSGCELLGKKKQLMPLSVAKSAGYGACGRCFPSTSMKAH
jgi:hypothetical protein